MSKEMIETPEAAVASIEWLAENLSVETIERAERDLECGNCTKDVVIIAAIFKGLEETTIEHASELAAEGFVLRTEEAQQRACEYRGAYDDLIKRFS